MKRGFEGFHPQAGMRVGSTIWRMKRSRNEAVSAYEQGENTRRQIDRLRSASAVRHTFTPGTAQHALALSAEEQLAGELWHSLEDGGRPSAEAPD